MRKPGRPRKKYPKASFVKRLLAKRTPWKVIEYKTGLCRHSIRKIVPTEEAPHPLAPTPGLFPHGRIISPASENCDEESSPVDSSPQAA